MVRKYYACSKKVIFWSYNQIDVSIVLLPSMIPQYSDFRNMKVVAISNCYSSEYLNSKVYLGQKKREVIFLSNFVNSPRDNESIFTLCLEQ